MYSKSIKAKYHYRVKKLFKMKIECSKFKSYHKYCHKMIEKSICHVLSIDNTGNIEVVYIVSARHAIIVYMQVSQVQIDCNDPTNDNKQGLFSSMLEFDDKNSCLNEALKQELDERLNLKVGIKIDKNQLEPGQNDRVVGDKIKISIQNENSLSFDPTSTLMVYQSKHNLVVQ